MAIGIYAKSGGVWRTITDPQVRVAGTWRPIQKAYAKVGGVWQLVYNRAFVFDASNGGTINADVNNWNLATQAGIAGWDGILPLVAVITLNAGKVVGSASLAAAMVIPALPTGSSVSFTNNGFVVGHGGNGGNGSNAGFGTNGTAGGLALSVAYATTIVNGGGTIGGGGGGGVGGLGTAGDGGGGGGGGAGRIGGTHGNGIAGGFNGADGVYNTFGAGGANAGGGGSNNGGDGGALGQVGNTDEGGWGVGGAAGDCTSGNVNITWSGATGNRWGALN